MNQSSYEPSLDFSNLDEELKTEIKEEPLEDYYYDSDSVIPSTKSEQFENTFDLPLDCLKTTNEDEDNSSSALIIPKVENEEFTQPWGDSDSNHSNEERQCTDTDVTSPTDESCGLNKIGVTKIEDVYFDNISMQEKVKQSEMSKVVFSPIMVLVKEEGEPDCYPSLSPKSVSKSCTSQLKGNGEIFKRKPTSPVVKVSKIKRGILEKQKDNGFINKSDFPELDSLMELKKTSNPGTSNAVRCGETENASEAIRYSTFSDDRIDSSNLTSANSKSSFVLNHNTEALKLYQNHNKEKSFSCHICSKKFSTKHYLSVHIRIHTGEKSFSCHICSKKFSQSGDLTKHLRVHTGEKPFSCHICLKKFSNRSGLPRHIRIHTGEQPFSCHICSKKFTRKSHLSDHVRIHTGEKPFSCQICSKKFSKKSGLSRHIRIHTEEEPFSCHICSNKFLSKQSLSRHFKIHTGD